ncbi:MAG: hypothetical protein WBF35_10140 [Candidatus Acidiferrales bacterium]
MEPKQENLARKRWHQQPLSVFLLYSFLFFLAYWGVRVPTSGKAVAVLGVAAALMAVLGEMGGKEKLAWIFLLFGFLHLELVSIDTEHLAEQQQLDATRDQLVEITTRIRTMSSSIMDLAIQSRSASKNTSRIQEILRLMASTHTMTTSVSSLPARPTSAAPPIPAASVVLTLPAS